MALLSFLRIITCHLLIPSKKNKSIPQKKRILLAMQKYSVNID